MLNWDEYDESKQQKHKEQPAPQKIAPVAETKEEKKDISVPSSVEAGERSKLAKKALENLDTREGEEELEGQSGRVQVDDKAMINCRADQSACAL